MPGCRHRSGSSIWIVCCIARSCFARVALHSSSAGRAAWAAGFMDENAATDKNAMIAGKAVGDEKAVIDVNAANAVTDANEHIAPIILNSGSLPEGAGPQSPHGATDRPDARLDDQPVVCTRRNPVRVNDGPDVDGGFLHRHLRHCGGDAGTLFLSFGR